MDIIIASNNKHKIQEIKAILGDKFNNIFSLSDKDINIDIAETGTTFIENAIIKARAICALTGIPTIADDSGLSVDALGGEPGVYSARYAGEPCVDANNNSKLIRNLDGVTDREAHFTSAVAICYPDDTIVTAEGYCHGRITLEASGSSGFGYDPYFYSYDLAKTFGEATSEEKNKISHRARALELLSKKL